MPRPDEHELDTVTQPRSPLAETVPAGAAGANAAEDVLGDDRFEHRYEVVTRLGEGGMGEVKLCLDRRIGREIALKTVRPDQGTRGELHARFLREARVQGQLEHPAIVPVYELGRDPAGAAYFTMKRLRGMTFEQIIDRLRSGDADDDAQLGRRRLLTAFASVCLAVHFAHTRGVLHRDLKPSNVMLGDFGEVYVLDWGLAKVRAPVASFASAFGERHARDSIMPESDRRYAPPSTRFEAAGESEPPVVVVEASSPAEEPPTLVGAAMGTPGYMAPEQVRGQLDRLDARTDVWALGAILFELLALEPLFARGKADEILAATLRGAEARFSIRCPERNVAPELEAIAWKATALDPDDRFRTARELSEAVERYLDGDRDVERRRAIAETHARTAAMLADRVDLTLDERRRAIGEVGRALALDPEHEGALATMVKLLTSLPRELPPDAKEQLDAIRRANVRRMRWAAMLGYASVILYTPFLLWMGNTNWWMPISFAILFGATSLASYLALRAPLPNGRPSYVALVLSTIAIGTISTVLGPFVLVPGVAVVNAAMYMMSPDRSRRWAVLACNALAFLLPFALDKLGLVSPFYDFRGDAMIVLPHQARFPALATQVFLIVSNLSLIVTTCVILGRFRDDLSAAEERLQLQAWQLRQLVPAAARGQGAAAH